MTPNKRSTGFGVFGVRCMGISRPCSLIHFSLCTLDLGALVLCDLSPHQQGLQTGQGVLWPPMLCVSFLSVSGEMDCMGAGHEWGDEDCPPCPGTFPQSDGTCREIGSHLERELSRAYLSAPRQSRSCLPSAGMAPFSTQLH